MEDLRIVYFPSPAALGKWLEEHHLETEELWVGYFKKATGKPSVTWPESVDEALCVGWIDEIRKRVDEDRYAIRFTPRRRGSVWSAVNIRRAGALIDAGRMRPTGLAAFEARRENRSGIYSYEQRRAELEEPYASLLKKHKTAWDFFQAQPPSYRKAASWWVVSAKKEETRRKRLKKLTEYSARRRRIPPLTPIRVSR
jgi:uncharacterized protein YdeI (YjbR/CyaY-like superfamily)